MKLTLEKIIVEDLVFGDHTRMNGTTLMVNKEEITKKIKEDKRIVSVTMDIVKPGESARLFSVRDVIEPRVKVEGAGEVFPGLVGSREPVGEGITKILKGSAVVITEKTVEAKAGIIDMSGPGAAYTPFSKTNNLVLDCDPSSGLESHQYEEALRLAGLKIAQYIGEKCQEVTGQEKVLYETLPMEEQKHMYPELPKVGYVYMLQSQGLQQDTYVYGRNAKQLMPTYIFPTEAMDGAIVSSNIMIPCDKNTTYHHLNNPMIEDLYERHGKDLNFCGVIITNMNVTLKDKVIASDCVAKLAEECGFDGVIISKEEYGNTDADLMMNCRKIEEKGIKTVLVTDEYAGRDGSSQSLADADPKADAVVSTGNANEAILLPPMEKVIGSIPSADRGVSGTEGEDPCKDSIQVELNAIMGATNELGFNKMSAIGC
ncbi:glycine/sarcosine/betaine reductase component B subunit [Tindallia californiensis]|uniref:Glycine reductase n=1 Tax=Tindallia californiensis TaxID=159292 RepID=A0A1H3QS54_9FIRM|nr:glycine/sarcosine/betaine reductase component B subunit [Tindallia californiensis]SDZ15549.1 glycine reductase [Tindallia californiensis]